MVLCTLKAKVGKTYSFKATVTPKDAKDKKVKWSTSNKKIATVASPVAVTVPFATVATLSLEVAHVTFLFVALAGATVAVNVAVAPILSKSEMVNIQ